MILLVKYIGIIYGSHWFIRDDNLELLDCKKVLAVGRVAYFCSNSFLDELCKVFEESIKRVLTLFVAVSDIIRQHRGSNLQAPNGTVGVILVDFTPNL